MPDPRKLYVCRFEVELVVYAKDVQQALNVVRVNYHEPAFNAACNFAESDLSKIDTPQDIPYDWRGALPYTRGAFSPRRKPEDEELTCQQIMEQQRSNAADGP